jgi:cytochrome b subunit of formate dehydrogenase
MMQQCGDCHEAESETYFETVHGKVSRLGDEGAAKCYDCHGTHNILSPEWPASTLSHDNVVGTCANCHPGAQRQFAGYLTHATHHDPDKYPYLYYAWVFMTSLLVGTLSVFLLHTLLWLFRLWRTRESWRPLKQTVPDRYYLRFTTQQRLMHLVMIVSFFTLTITGMTLKFSYMGWASVISHGLGGFEVTGVLHRIAAVALLGLFAYHLAQVVRQRRETGKGWIAYLTDKNSMLPNRADAIQLWQNLRWFFGRGERPIYGRFTYWEKFDYFAVFWGVFIIGGTGLILWFPTFFTRFMPGWAVNVATIIHSDEALLATAFIFTIHFFNTHFRPDKFPMDPVIFTGRVALDELAHDKPGEHADLMASADPEARMAGPVSTRRMRWIRIFGFSAVTIGLALVGLIIYGMLYTYR